jgi:hypothetical protein
MTAASSTDPRAPKRLTQQELVAELQKLYSRKGIRRDVFGRRAALPSEVAAWVADTRQRRESGQE